MTEKKKREPRPKVVKPRITYGEYYIMHSDHAPTHFDVHIEGKRDALSYGHRLPAAIEYIALHKMSRKTGDRTIKEFLSEFRGLVNEIKMAVDTSNLGID